MKDYLVSGKFICSRIQKARAEDKKCHVKTMMSKKSDRSLKETPNMYHLVRTWRKEKRPR
jgi:hypothetical protein